MQSKSQDFVSCFGRNMPKCDYLARYSAEQREQIESIAKLILTGENDNITLAATLAVGFDCRRAAWQRAVEIDTLDRLMRDEPFNGTPSNCGESIALSPLMMDYNRIADDYLQAFHQVCAYQNIKSYQLKG
jgi:hypothetical protein